MVKNIKELNGNIDELEEDVDEVLQDTSAIDDRTKTINERILELLEEQQRATKRDKKLWKGILVLAIIYIGFIIEC